MGEADRNFSDALKDIEADKNQRERTGATPMSQVEEDSAVRAAGERFQREQAKDLAERFGY